jgi:enolase
MSALETLKAREILNSRGDLTIEVFATLQNGITAVASVPEGKSKGSLEAASLPAEEAAEHVNNIIAPAFKGMNVSDQPLVDGRLAELDGTKNKSRLGANATLAVSIVSARLASREKKAPLWRHIHELSGRVSEESTLRLFANMINGGLHAGNNLEFQEYLVIPKDKNIPRSVSVIVGFYKALGEALVKKIGRHALLLGDEGGFAPNFHDNLEPFAVLKEVADELGIGEEIEFGLDAAATNIKTASQALIPLYTDTQKKHGLTYLEDPFAEDDFDSFALLRTEFPELMIAGDDLTVTNIERLEIAREKGSVNSVIIKPNQIGTVSEAIAAVKQARLFGWSVVVSHRSGETNDDFIADFAYGVGADGLKLGAPARGERVAKYNRLLRIAEEAAKKED